MSPFEQYPIIRAHTEYLCSFLQAEDYVPQPVPFVSPPKWHLAHSTWFFEEFLLKKHLEGYIEFDADFGYLFNSYYNTVGKRILRAQRGNITRPSTEKIYDYRRHVDRHMEILARTKNTDPELQGTVLLGLNHEQQHQELLLTDIKYILGHNPLFPAYNETLNWEAAQEENAGFITVPEGIYTIGDDGNGFSFDNEHGVHKVLLDAFEISGNLVTNAEYMEFIEAGGYSNFRYWLDEGWSWVLGNDIHAPMYWHNIDGKWYQYTLGGLQQVHSAAMLTHISFYEAAAYAEWKGMRLPTEFEWEAASRQLNWGNRWEWTHSAYLPYPRFRKPEGAIGEYNGKFMINQMVLRGASCATPAGHSRNTYRNFFHPDERWQFTGIRLVKL
ncbi:ergothioneine biosynthesis protein EgtB [Flavobacterium sp. MFBS3-15]|uniref:ergothioneine biosynthesis protein EgtB n=1 Tax=Flavobacterium sp. MFBS3-15 TaxID=2989816 RepID=UPI002235BBBC|nr:ergothioneine biosynthesis protein EgtB [Flavobacterium sp. MFBS3-15]MCW4470657.1 ergothioneine biosynthesis protein EgtB [Flavobacterium sp. MFBS3-15]